MNSKERSFSKIKDFADWDDVDTWLWDILMFLDGKTHNFKYVYGIPRGGLIPAVFLSHHLNLELIFPDESDDYDYRKDVLFVDDVVSTGKTTKGLNNIVSLIRNPWAPEILFAAKETDHWVQFPWENK